MGSSPIRVLLTVILCVGIIVAWQYFESSRRSKNETIKEGDALWERHPSERKSLSKSSAESSSTKKTETERGLQPENHKKELGPLATRFTGKLTEIATPFAHGTFTSTGGALQSWRLSEPRFQERQGTSLVPVDLVQIEKERGPWSLVITFPGSDFQVPGNAAFSEIKHTANQLGYRWESSQILIEKHYHFEQERPVIWLSVYMKNQSSKLLKYRMELSLFLRQNPSHGKPSFTNPYPKISTGLCFVYGEILRRSVAGIQGEQSNCSAGGCGMGSGPVSQVGQVQWTGVDSRYFLMGVVPVKAEGDRRCELDLIHDKIMRVSLQFSEKKLRANATEQVKFLIYLGPKELNQLDSAKGPDGQNTRLSESIEFGWFAILCRPMLWLLKLIHSLLGNWGLAIIFLTICVKIITLYWTNKSMKSMKDLQRLRPKMDLIREKYKGDKQRLNQEIMALYKIHKINPLGGCLPMLIQMPIWFALYRTLGNSVELYRSSFFGWITDLTAPDPYYILPIAMGISMYAQQAISPQPLEGTQAKMMKYFMPGMFTVMMLALPSGLTLYIFVNTILTMIHQWYMNKKDKDKGSKGGEPLNRPVNQRMQQAASLIEKTKGNTNTPSQQKASSGVEEKRGKKRRGRRKKAK